ncbi:MAG TPA: MgtC/SapB family protein [Pyrinomonadaceae bacterium]|nr:MgtC/SapB family protein [Pyrinomonadaceae bacterium]
MDFLIEAFTFEWKQTLVDFLRVALAFAFAVPIGWERHKSERNLGLRTFPIVAMAACGLMLIAKNVPGANAETQARLLQGLIGGIGFIGGGAILKEGANVRGLATAASLWATGAIGAAVAFEREEIALVLSLIMFVTLRTLTPIVENGDENGGEEESKKTQNTDVSEKESS